MSAAILNKFMNMIGVTEAEDDIEEIENEYETVEEEVYERPVRTRAFGRDRDEGTRSATKVLPMSGTVTTSKVVIAQPSCFDDVTEVGEHIKQRKSLIVNLESVNKNEAERIIDFLSGAVYVTDGNMQKISNLIFLVTPKTVEIQNEIERAKYREKLSFSWLK